VLALLVEVSTLDLGGGGSGQLPTGQRQMQHPVVMVVSSAVSAAAPAPMSANPPAATSEGPPNRCQISHKFPREEAPRSSVPPPNRTEAPAVRPRRIESASRARSSAPWSRLPCRARTSKLPSSDLSWPQEATTHAALSSNT
jgi:hypothetical protein